MILDDVASYVLNFSSISTRWRVFKCAESDRGFWAASPAINSEKQFIAMCLPFQRHEFYCRLVNSRLVQWEGVTAHIERTKSNFSPIKHSSVTLLRLNGCYLFFFFKKDQTCTCICTGTWVALSNICVTKVNMRNCFVVKCLIMFIAHSRYS